MIPRNHDNPAKDIFVSPKVEPPCILSNVMVDTKGPSLHVARYYFWTWLRAYSTFDQTVPSITVWLLQLCNKESIAKTLTTYLPPLDYRVTEFKTIVTYMKYLQILPVDVGIPYVNITLDCGAALNGFKTKWSQPEPF